MAASLKRTTSWDDKLMSMDDRNSAASKLGLKQRRKSISLGMSLPPIIESSKSPVAASNSSKSSGSETDSRGHEHMFGRLSRRASIAAISSITLSSSTNTSLDKINSPAKQNAFQSGSSIQRRGSILNSMPNGRRTSFRTIGSKVTTLLRAKNAFSLLKNKPKVELEEDIDDEKVYEIKEMPKQPRFASTLSAEAQYAMMKGYEDVVYSCLCNSYPEYRPMLRRNRTPLTGVDVRVSSGNHDKAGRADKYIRIAKETKHEEAIDVTDGASRSPVPTQSPMSSTPVPGEQGHVRSSLPEERIDVSLKAEAATPKPNVSHLSKANAFGKTRSVALPRKVPRDKQLVMTYRYQSAMDILDNLRENVGVHSLSPRVKGTPKLEPVKDFNSWSHVWNKEFVPKQGREKT